MQPYLLGDPTFGALIFKLGSWKMEFLNKLKSGEFGLAKTYWVFGVIVFIPLNILYELDVLSPDTILITFFASLFYMYFWTIGCWTAASNYEGPIIWHGLAKTAVALNLIGLLLGLISMAAVLR